MSDKKRLRTKETNDDDNSVVKIVAIAKMSVNLGEDVTLAMCESLEFTYTTLSKCKTLKDFKEAWTTIEQRT